MRFAVQGVDELAPIDATLEKEHDERTKVKNVQVRALAQTLGFRNGGRGRCGGGGKWT